MATIHSNEKPVTLNVYCEIWGDMRTIVIERWQGSEVIDSISIHSEEEAEEFVTEFLTSMSTLGWENG